MVVVLIDDGLRWGIDLSVPQDIECAHGQRMGMVLRGAATRAGGDSKDDAKHQARQGQAWGRRCLKRCDSIVGYILKKKK